MIGRQRERVEGGQGHCSFVKAVHYGRHRQAHPRWVGSERLNEIGWNLACLQRPAGLHMCVTPAHAEPMMRLLVDDLRECVAEAGKTDPGDKEGNAAIYGTAEALPDRHIIGDVLVAYQEATLDS